MTDQSLTPGIPPSFPREGNAFTRWIGRLGLRAFGWRITGSFPDVGRLVMAVAPHTSNWDFPIGLAAKLAVGFRASWLGKHSLFSWPFGRLMRSLGGIPIDRHAASGVVEQVAARFDAGGPLILVVAPEGTRRRVERLKTGFIRIAIAADVPILLIAFDYPSREIRLGELYRPTGDVDADELHVREYFKAFAGKFPDQYCA